jgi:hypothetical protein
MQIDLALYAEVATTQPAQDRGGDMWAVKRQRLSSEMLGVLGRARVETLAQYCGTIRAGEACLRPPSRWPRLWRMRAQGPYTAHRSPEQSCLVGIVVRVIVIRQGSHRWLRQPSSASSIVSRSPAAHPHPRQ